ncbi:hypothetical protein V7659_10020 [Neobacillus drentensis]|uniref:hypothetical protein n=1 Tax=Neobacillus drentensis TaxID=220684 RepID=UPI003000F449
MMIIGFQTANYFARATNYQTSMDLWGEAERKVIETFSLAEFDRICGDIQGAGFQDIELWMGHSFPKFMTPFFAEELQKIWKSHGLSVYSYSCSLGDPVRYPRWTRLCFETAKMLGIELITSGITKESAPVIYSLCNSNAFIGDCVKSSLGHACNTAFSISLKGIDFSDPQQNEEPKI